MSLSYLLLGYEIYTKVVAGEKVLEEGVQAICWGNQVFHQGRRTQGKISVYLLSNFVKITFTNFG